MKENKTKKTTFSTEQSVENTITNNEIIINSQNNEDELVFEETNEDIIEEEIKTNEDIIEEEIKTNEDIIEETIISEPIEDKPIEIENASNIAEDIVILNDENNNNISDTNKIVLSGKQERLMRRNGNIKF